MPHCLASVELFEHSMTIIAGIIGRFITFTFFSNGCLNLWKDLWDLVVHLRSLHRRDDLWSVTVLALC